MKICSISDTHGLLYNNIKPCELLFICGDIFPLDDQCDTDASLKWLSTDFTNWIYNLPCEKVYIVAGNHDFALQEAYNDPDIIEDYLTFPTQGKAKLLLNTSDVYTSKEGKDYVIYGSPFCQLRNWAFFAPSYLNYRILMDTMPDNCDVAIFHDAPYGVSDVCLETSKLSREHLGNRALKNAIIVKRPKLVLHGHLHSSNHDCERLDGIKVYNTSLLSDFYHLCYKPLYLDI